MRFVVACGAGEQGPDVVLSAFSPEEGDVELMAWDQRSGGFNFYRTVGSKAIWVFAGNSRDALGGDTEGNGPFESHRSGSFLMKELRPPWINWDSPDGEIDPAVMPEGLGTHEWFNEKEQLGALTCEEQVARPSIRRWATSRFDELAASGTVPNPGRVMRQILDTPAVNLVSSTKKPHDDDGEPIDLPPTFFLDSEGLSEILGIPLPTPSLAVDRGIYSTTLERFEVRLEDQDQGFEQPGDTFFAFVVPERASEDEEVLRHALRVGLLTRRLGACLLMTDFANPVFSARRAKLLDHVPDGPASIAGGQSTFSQDMADAILAAVDDEDDDTPESEFKRLWDVGDDFEGEFAGRLGAYIDALGGPLASQADFDSVYELAEWRRGLVRGMPIAEFPLLFSVSTLTESPPPRAMRPDASVVEPPPIDG
jgi:hypothetical protein